MTTTTAPTAYKARIHATVGDVDRYGAGALTVYADDQLGAIAAAQAAVTALNAATAPGVVYRLGDVTPIDTTPDWATAQPRAYTTGTPHWGLDR